MNNKKSICLALICSAVLMIAFVGCAAILSEGNGERNKEIYFRPGERQEIARFDAFVSSDYADIVVKFAETQGPLEFLLSVEQNGIEIGQENIAVGESVIFTVSGYSGTAVYAKSNENNADGNVIFEASQTVAVKAPATAAYHNAEYGFTIEFLFEYGDAIDVNLSPTDGYPIRFEFTAARYGIGMFAYINVWPSGTSYRPDYNAMDVPFTEIGSNGKYDFVLVRATDFPLDPLNDESSAAFEAIRDAFDAGQYQFALVDLGDGSPDDSLLSPWIPLSDLPADYGVYDKLEKAISDNAYINVQGAEIYNQSTVDFFYKSVADGIAAFMRTIEYTVEGDPIITDYRYDGEIFTVATDTTRDKFGSPEIFTETYRYLVPHNRSRPAGVPMSFYLSNNANIYEGTPDGDGIRLKEDGLGRIPSPSDSVGSLFL